MITSISASNIINSDKVVITTFGGDTRFHTTKVVISPIVTCCSECIHIVKETEDYIIIDFDNLSDLANAVYRLNEKAEYVKTEYELKEQQGDGYCEWLHDAYHSYECSCKFLKSHWHQ